MTACPAGHDSGATDYCDVCGRRMDAVAGRAPASQAPTQQAPAAQASVPQVPAQPAPSCPRCGAY